MPNLLANIALIGYPLFAFLLFFVMRPLQAVWLGFLVGDLILPSNFDIDLPGLPPLDKRSGPAAAALLGILIMGRRQIREAKPFRGGDALALLVILGSLFTRMTNRDPVFHGPVVLPGESTYDFISDSIRFMLLMWVPLYLGRALIRDLRDLTFVFRTLVIAGLIYTLPMLIELRLSPQFHNWIYGYFPSTWLQAVRTGGYRPVVFFSHGLPLAFFMLFCVLVAFILARARVTVMSLSAWPVFVYLLIVLLLCRSTGVLIYAALAIPLLLVTRPERVVKGAAIVALLVFAYPIFRINGLVPTAQIVDAASWFGADRAQSLSYRLENETVLMEHARQRLWFGWGGFGRNLVYDNESGKVLTVVDGLTIITITARGLVGYAGMFGMILAPLWLCFRRWKKLALDRKGRVLVGQLAALVAIMAVDLIINTNINPYLLMLAGGLEGVSSGSGDTPVAGPPGDVR